MEKLLLILNYNFYNWKYIIIKVVIKKLNSFFINIYLNINYIITLLNKQFFYKKHFNIKIYIILVLSKVLKID